ncbi:MAG: PKD domain-containing protein [Dysgonamonadaceae bacterium]|jgi:PKD repeat protein|nr:PKD domain-containing protein [Dysgonamonadaceae bacterium]
MTEKFKLAVTNMIMVWAIAYSLSATAQISEGGLPPSFTFEGISLRSASGIHEVAVDFDVNRLLKEDDEAEMTGIPPRCATIIPVSLNVENSGNRSTLPDGQHIWNLEIYAPKALAILLYYDKFIIPEGGKLFIYNPDHSKILGAYTHRTNSKKAEFATEFVPGDRIILEYVAPLSPSGELVLPQIEISGIAYGYNHLRVPAGNGLWRSRWDSEPCMVNVNCPEGDDWQDQKKGVARIVTPVGYNSVSLCSGTLINNTSGNFDPLFLSAYHCFDNMSAATLNQSIYYFNYEYPACVNLETDPNVPTMTGAQLLVALAIDGESDGALLRLNDSIPENYDVYFNGWDRRNIPPQSGVCIHHPGGDVKKISTFTSKATSMTWYGEGTMGADNAHWNVFFSPTTTAHSVTQGGSSGSPLFNENKLITGTLTGGSSTCQFPYGHNIYGKLSYHWNQGLQKMNQYLDPDNTGMEYIEGVYPNYAAPQAKFRTKQKEIYVTQSVEFINVSTNDNTWEWLFEGGTPSVSVEKNPPLVTFNLPGIHPVSLTINKGTPDEKTFSQEIEVVIKESLCPEEITTGDVISNKISQFPLGALHRQTLSSSIYTAAELGLPQGGKIKKIAWNTQIANTTERRLWVYLKETGDSAFPASAKWTDELEGATLVYENADTWTDGWTTIALPEEYRYDGSKNLKVIVRTIAPDDEGTNSRCAYSIASNKHLQSSSASIGLPSGGGTRESKRPVIRLSVDRFCGAELPSADFKIATFAPDESAEVRICDTIRMTDLSTGPAVNWEWLFPGGTPETSTEASPSVVYKQPGNYTVTLNISNHLGTNSKQKTVTVNSRTPIAAFSSSSSGFTTYPDYGQFLSPEGGTVTFTDNSLYYPTEWEWELNGIEPVLATEKTVTVTYPPGENTYSVQLTAVNTAGSHTETIADYIQTGGTARIWNIPYGDEGKTCHELPEGGYLTGTNAAYAILAEKFTSPATGILSQVDIWLNVLNDKQLNSRRYTITVYNEKDGLPGDNLGSVTIRGLDVNRSGYTGAVFAAPIAVEGNFYVEIKGIATVSATEVAVGSSESSEPTVYVYKNNEWKPLEDYDPERRKVSMNIVPTYTYTSATDWTNPAKEVESAVSVYPNPADSYLAVSSRHPVKKIIVRDIQGRRIHEINRMEKETVIPVSGWGKGIYIVNVQLETESCNYKIIKK